MKVVFTGGGTAGHIFPIIAIVREMKKADKNLDFYYLGPKDDFASALLSKEGVTIKTVLAGKLRRYFSILNLLDIFKIPIGILQSFFYIFTISPEFVFSKGGYGSLPVVVSSWFLMTPIFLHESDVIPGLANKITSKIAKEIFIAFPKVLYFPQNKVFSVGNPLRKEILQGSKEKAVMMFNLKGGKPVLLILGGSQGAQQINDIILIALEDILEDFEVIHQTGQQNFEQVKAESKTVIHDDAIDYYHPIGFLNETELSNALAISDIVLSRSGAGSIFEISAVGKPSILVPLPNSAQEHQVRNAYAFAETGATIVMEQANFTPHFLLERLNFLAENKEKMTGMAKIAKSFSNPDSARIIAEYLVDYLNQ